jgi:hypothetical protein
VDDEAIRRPHLPVYPNRLGRILGHAGCKNFRENGLALLSGVKENMICFCFSGAVEYREMKFSMMGAPNQLFSE